LTGKYIEALRTPTPFCTDADRFGLRQDYVPDVVVKNFPAAHIISILWLVGGGENSLVSV